MSEQHVHTRTDEGFRDARRAGAGLASPRYWGTALLLVGAVVVTAVTVGLASGNEIEVSSGAEGVEGYFASAFAHLLTLGLFVLVGVVVALAVLPVALLLCGGLILRWLRAAPAWRRAARRQPTRVLHADLLPKTRTVGRHVVRTVRVRDAEVLPVLHLYFVPGAAEHLAGPVALELFGGERVGGPVRVGAVTGAAWAFDATAAEPGAGPEVEVEAEFSGSPLEPTLEAYSIDLSRPNRGRRAPLSPAGDGFRAAYRAGTRGTSPWRWAPLAALSVFMSGVILVIAVTEVWETISTSGSLDPWLLMMAGMSAMPLLFLPDALRKARQRRLIGPAWRRAAARRPTLALAGTILPGTQAVGTYGMRTVHLDRPIAQGDGEAARRLQLLFVTAEGWGERLVGPVVVRLFAGDLLRGPALVQDAHRAEWAFAVRDDNASRADSGSRDGWDDGGWTETGDGGDGGDGGE
ncbi:hypothetical protein SUDANB121_05808 [Nocardiopsis dassonvillei]|uniref:hypothetical protein n=1 Tax=Nocardiopsis dassonvillei TaxID=2014 RepID=UPI003F56E8F8